MLYCSFLPSDSEKSLDEGEDTYEKAYADFLKRKEEEKGNYNFALAV